MLGLLPEEHKTIVFKSAVIFFSVLRLIKHFLATSSHADELWVFGYGPEATSSSHPNGTIHRRPIPRKLGKFGPNQKAMLITNLILKELFELFIINLLWQAKPSINISIWSLWNDWDDAVKRKCPTKWQTNSWFLQWDNAPAHAVLSAVVFG